MKAKLNIHLLSTLPRVLRMTHNEVADASGISIACWYRLVKNPEKITVQQLLGISNGLEVPVTKFFSFGRTDIVGTREDYIMQSNYQKCYYDSDAMHRRIGDGTATSWRKAAGVVGMHWTNVAASLLAESRTPVTRLLALCEAFGFSPFEFLVDPNREHKQQAAGERDLHKELTDLRRQVSELQSTVSGLSRKYADLQERHAALEASIRKHLGTGGQAVMAADEPG